MTRGTEEKSNFSVVRLKRSSEKEMKKKEKGKRGKRREKKKKGKRWKRNHMKILEI